MDAFQSVVAIVQVAVALVEYIDQVHKGPEERKQLRDEINDLSAILQSFRSKIASTRADERDAWTSVIASLLGPGKVVTKLEADLIELDRELRPSSSHRWRSKAQYLTWPWDKKATKELLDRTLRAKTSIILAVEAADLEINLDTRSNVDRLGAILARQRELEYLDWISPSDAQIPPRKHALEGTDAWFLSSEPFRDFAAGDIRALWCHGAPGAGKSVLACSAFSHLRSNNGVDGTAVAAVFCKFSEQFLASEMIANVLRQVVRQLSPKDREAGTSGLYGAFLRDTEAGTRQHEWDLVAAREALRSELSNATGLAVIVDGLDEVLVPGKGVGANVLEALWSLGSKCRIMVFSRRLPEIQSWFAERENTAELVIAARSEDLRKYIHWRVESSPNLSEITERMSFIKSLEELNDDVQTHCQQTFLLAQLHMDQLEDQESPSEILEALSTLTQDQAGTYEKAFQRIEKTCRNARAYDRVLRMMLLVAYAEEPLSVSEMEHALAVKPGKPSKHLLYDIVAIKSVIDKSAGLVQIDDDDMVRFWHETVRYHVVQKLKSQYPDPQGMMAETCLAYVETCVSVLTESQEEDVAERLAYTLQQHSFSHYAIDWWGNHAFHGWSPRLLEPVLRFLRNERYVGVTTHAMQYFGDTNSSNFRIFRTSQRVTGLHFAAFYGLDLVVKSLLAEGVDCEVTDALDTTPLMFAAAGSEAEVVRTLLQAGAQPSRVCQKGLNPMLLACWAKSADDEDSREVAKSLASWEGDIGINQALTEPGYNGMNALCFAVEYRWSDVVELLLARDDIDPCPEIPLSESGSFDVRTSPILCAIHYHYFDIARLLLADDRVKDVLNDTRVFTTPLHETAARGHIDTLNLLLAAGADPNVGINLFQGPALLRTIHEFQFDAFKVLFGVTDHTLTDKNGRGLLHYCAIKKNIEALTFALEMDSKLDVNLLDKDGRTPLHFVAYSSGSVQCANLLLDRGARTDIVDAFENSVESVAVDEGHLELISLLQIKRTKPQHGRSGAGILYHNANDQALPGADPVSGSGSFDTPKRQHLVNTIIQKDEDDLIQYLDSLKQDLDSIVDDRYRSPDTSRQETPLVAALRHKKPTAAKVLLKAGADSNALNGVGQTALHYAVAFGYADVAEELVKVGSADPNVIDHFSFTPLSLAAQRGHRDIAVMLIEYGADAALRPVEPYRDKLLCWAAEHGDLSVVRKLVEAGASPTARDEDGRAETARQKASKAGHDDVAEFLFQAQKGRVEVPR